VPSSSGVARTEVFFIHWFESTYLAWHMPVGGKRNPEENGTDSETNENHEKKTFSRDTTKEG
jgi:hypothetical protein